MKNYILAVIVLITTNYAAAQTQVGLRGGVNFLNYSDATSLNLNGKTGFNIGGFARFKFVAWGIQPELKYTTEKSTYTYSGAKEEALSIQYLDMPILGKFYVVPMFSLNAGPVFKFKVGDNFKETVSSVKQSIKNFDFGASIGASGEFSKFDVDLRYVFGFDNIFNNSNNSSKSNSFQLSVGYSFL